MGGSLVKILQQLLLHADKKLKIENKLHRKIRSGFYREHFFNSIIRADLESIECDGYPAVVLDRKQWRKKIKGPYTAQAEVAPTQRLLGLVAKSQK